jgi:signal peptidase complex subunit 1
MAKGFWNILGEIVISMQDFEGQRKAERIYQVLITFACFLGFLVSIWTRQFMYTGYAALYSTCFAIVLVLFPWPFYKKSPLKWAKGN